MEITKQTISNEEITALKEFSSDDEIEKFFVKLNYNYGDGEVLTFPQIFAFLRSGLFNNTSIDALTMYVDIVRMLSMLPPKEAEPYNHFNSMCTNVETLISVHDRLVSLYKPEINEQYQKRYTEAVEPLIPFTKDFLNIRVELIATLDELNTEGTSMNHCIATYFNIVINKQYVGFRVFNKSNNERLTLGCIRHTDGNLYFNQLKGYENCPASKDSCVKVIEYCHEQNILITEQNVHDLMPALM